MNCCPGIGATTSSRRKPPDKDLLARNASALGLHRMRRKLAPARSKFLAPWPGNSRSAPFLLPFARFANCSDACPQPPVAERRVDISVVSRHSVASTRYEKINTCFAGFINLVAACLATQCCKQANRYAKVPTKYSDDVIIIRLRRLRTTRMANGTATASTNEYNMTKSYREK
jgi:hypothetical protein